MLVLSLVVPFVGVGLTTHVGAAGAIASISPS